MDVRDILKQINEIKHIENHLSKMKKELFDELGRTGKGEDGTDIKALALNVARKAGSIMGAKFLRTYTEMDLKEAYEFIKDNM